MSSEKVFVARCKCGQVVAASYDDAGCERDVSSSVMDWVRRGDSVQIESSDSIKNSQSWGCTCVGGRQASPLYCDTCGDELQRESCNHVRGCVKCLKAAQAKVREETLRDVLLIVKAEYHSHEASSMSNVSCWENQHTARIERKIKTIIPTPAQEQRNG